MITENVMEHVANTFVPFTLKERQADRKQIVMVISEEVDRSMWSIHQFNTTTVTMHHHQSTAYSIITPQPALAGFSVQSRTDFKLATLCFKSQDNLSIWLNLYICTNPSDPYVLRHWIYSLYLTVEQSWVGVVSQ